MHEILDRGRKRIPPSKKEAIHIQGEGLLVYPTHFWWTYGAEILHGSRYQPREDSGYPGWGVGSIFGGVVPRVTPDTPGRLLLASMGQ